MPLGLTLSYEKNLYPNGREWATPQMANLRGEPVDSPISILPLPSANCPLGGQMSGYRSGKFLVLRIGNYPLRWMNS